MYKKGDIVRIKAVVRSGYDVLIGETIIAGKDKGRHRKLFRRECSNRDNRFMVVGISRRITGSYHKTNEHGVTVGWLSGRKHHKVVLVVPLYTSAWIKPSACLEEDLEIISNEGEE